MRISKNSHNLKKFVGGEPKLAPGWGFEFVLCRRPSLSPLPGGRNRRGNTFRGAMNAAAPISDARYKSKAYEAIARYLLGKGDRASAQGQLESISEAGIRTQLSITLAEKFAARRDERKVGDILSQARNFAQMNKNSWALREVAIAQAQAGDLDGALDTAAVISNNSEKGSAYDSLAYLSE